MVERHVLQTISDDRLRVYVVWGPMLGDETEEQARQATVHLPDSRVTHFWIGSNTLAEAFARQLGLARGAAWDAYLLFAPRSRWNEPVPRPDDFMHQMGDLLPADRRFNGATLADKVRAALR